MASQLSNHSYFSFFLETAVLFQLASPKTGVQLAQFGKLVARTESMVFSLVRAILVFTLSRGTERLDRTVLPRRRRLRSASIIATSCTCRPTEPYLWIPFASALCL